MNIRLIKPGEEVECKDFHNRLYGHERTMSQWRWEFVENTYDRLPVPFAVAEDNGRIVGTQAYIPIQMIDRDGVHWTAKSEETLVDPDYRGQGTFEKMYALLFQYAEKNRFRSVWGFTPAIKAFKRLEFTIPGNTKQLFLPFSSRSVTSMLGKMDGVRCGLLTRMKHAALHTGGSVARVVSAIRTAATSRKLPSGLEIRTLEKADPQSGDCCKRFIKQWGGVTIYRDSKYLQWRLFDNPYVKSIVRAIYDGDELLGWVAFTLGDDGLGYLVDLIVTCDPSKFRPSHLVRSLLLEAVLGTRNMGATGIRGWQVNKHPFDQLVCRESRKVGFFHIKRGHWVVLYHFPAGRTRACYDSFDDWYISRIYTEGILS